MAPLGRLQPALLAVQSLLREHGLPADRLEVWKDGSNLLVRPVPAPVILRVATFTGRIRRDPVPYLRREVELVTWLTAHGAPVMAPATTMPPGPHMVDGWGIAAWRFEEHEAGVVPGARATLAALGRLHDTLRAYPGDLPLLGPAASDLDLALAFAVGEEVIAPDRAAALATRRDELVARLLAFDAPLVPQHGDAFPRNAVATRRGVVWIDLEDACRAPVAWDLAVLVRATGDPAIRAEVVRRIGAAPLETALALREIQAGVWNELHDARGARGW